MFYVDAQGHQRDEKLSNAIDCLRERASFVSVLGSYPEAD